MCSQKHLLKIHTSGRSFEDAVMLPRHLEHSGRGGHCPSTHLCFTYVTRGGQICNIRNAEGNSKVSTCSGGTFTEPSKYEESYLCFTFMEKRSASPKKEKHEGKRQRHWHQNVNLFLFTSGLIS